MWDKTTDYKFVIEFTSKDYVGALLPALDENSGSLVWKNVGQITITSPMVTSDWQYSQFICDATGVAYNQLVSYLQDSEDLFTYYQPVEAVFYRNASGDSPHSVVQARDSFWFVGLLVDKLASYGADTDAFLDVYATAYQYIALLPLQPPVVAWPAGGEAHPEVYSWYQQLTACYGAAYDTAASTGGGADSFLKVGSLGCCGLSVDCLVVVIADPVTDH